MADDGSTSMTDTSSRVTLRHGDHGSPSSGHLKHCIIALLLHCVGQSVHDGLALFILSHAEHVSHTCSIRVSPQTQGVDQSVCLQGNAVDGPDNLQDGAGAL